MKPDKAIRGNQQVLRNPINKKNTITRQSSRKSEKSVPAQKSKHAKRRSDINQAISEALNDYTAEHVDEYSKYQKELIPQDQTIQKKQSNKEKPSFKKKTKRTHSFDIQTTKSPVLAPKKKSPVPNELPPLEPFSLEEKAEKQRPTGRFLCVLHKE